MKVIVYSLLALFMATMFVPVKALAHDPYERYVAANPDAPTTTTTLRPKTKVKPLKSYYIRLDGGVDINTEGDMTAIECVNNAIMPGVGCASFTQRDTISGDYDKAFVYGAGVGINSSYPLRADLNLMFHKGFTFEGKTPGIYNDYKAKIDSMAIMLNGYVDFVKDRRRAKAEIYPYLGAGIGISENKMKTLTFRSISGFDYSMAGAKQTELAWMATAGLSSRLNEFFILDLAYRYIDLGEVKTQQGVTNTTLGVSLVHDGLKGDNITAHEITLGARFNF